MSTLSLIKTQVMYLFRQWGLEPTLVSHSNFPCNGSKSLENTTPVKTDKAEGFVKIQSTGNVGSSPHCLRLS